MMKYEIFKDVVENAVLDYLPPEYQNSELHLKRVKKVNGIIGKFLYLLGRYGFDAQIGYGF